MPRKPPPGKSLAEVNPELAKEWHPTRNNLTPKDISCGSNKKIWWKCDKGPDHEWEASPDSRKRGRGCPICKNKKVVLSNCLATVNPKLSEEWHPTKNGKLSPKVVIAGSAKKVWWRCGKDSKHEWRATISTRNKGQLGCPICEKEKLITNSLANKNPLLASEWHPIRNGKLTAEDVTPGSDKKVWWKCDKGDDHEWEAIIKDRNKGSGCAICANYKTVFSNSLGHLHPNLAKEWHPTKNGKKTIYNTNPGTHSKVWWKCDKGDDHEWQAVVKSRTNNDRGCPICDGKKVVKSNSLAIKSPTLAKEWHPTLNGSKTPHDYTELSGKKIWWKCDKGPDHEWVSTIANRTNGNGCPFCDLTPQSRQELIITFELLTIFKGINPKGFKTRVNGKLWSIDTFIPSLNVGIEFDGAYWHKDKAQLDKVKTEQIEETGLNLIRVRQKPLERLFEDDVMAENKFDGKQITNDILKQIVKDDGKYTYKLNKRTLDKIDKYLKLEGLQNEKGLDKYIDQILTEKAERKK